MSSSLPNIHWHPKQKEFFKCYDAFLRTALIGHSHPNPFWKIAKITAFEALWKCHQATLSKTHLRLSPSAENSRWKWMNWIISKSQFFLFWVPMDIKKDWKAKLESFHSFMSKYSKITVWLSYVSTQHAPWVTRSISV